MAQINKDMLVTEVLAVNPQIANILGNHGMSCFGCPRSQGKTLETAASGHGVDVDALVGEINQFLAA